MTNPILRTDLRRLTPLVLSLLLGAAVASANDTQENSLPIADAISERALDRARKTIEAMESEVRAIQSEPVDGSFEARIRTRLSSARVGENGVDARRRYFRMALILRTQGDPSRSWALANVARASLQEERAKKGAVGVGAEAVLLEAEIAERFHGDLEGALAALEGAEENAQIVERRERLMARQAQIRDMVRAGQDLRDQMRTESELPVREGGAQ